MTDVRGRKRKSTPCLTVVARIASRAGHSGGLPAEVKSLEEENISRPRQRPGDSTSACSQQDVRHDPTQRAPQRAGRGKE